MAPKKVLVVGAGAAGMSCAHHLSHHPEKFSVTVIESSPNCGGQAFSIPLDSARHGASWLNQGVQGGSHVFRHTLHIMDSLGFPAAPVRLQVSFGKGNTFWTNVFPTQILARHGGEVRRFAAVVGILRWVELAVGLLPVWFVLKILGFSTEFVDAMVLPSIALFLGTGNATPLVPTIFMERLFTSDTFGMWAPPDKDSFISTMPPMVVFRNLSEFYSIWASKLRERGVAIRLETTLIGIVSRSGGGKGVDVAIQGPDTVATTEHYDELVLCIPADTAKRVLGTTATWLERAILGSVIFSDDVTVTHSDASYMMRHYTVGFDATQAVGSLNGVDTNQRLDKGVESFTPMYYVRGSDQNRGKHELSFDCTHYQAQFRGAKRGQEHVYQSIFLDEARDRQLWSKDRIEKERVVREDRWRQVCHRWTHYVRVMPWLWSINGGGRNTLFAGSWTVVNTHETAVLSGLAAAWRLGAEYPEDMKMDRVAWNSFWGYCMLVHGMWVKGGPWLRR